MNIAPSALFATQLRTTSLPYKPRLACAAYRCPLPFQLNGYANAEGYQRRTMSAPPLPHRPGRLERHTTKAAAHHLRTETTQTPVFSPSPCWHCSWFGLCCNPRLKLAPINGRLGDRALSTPFQTGIRLHMPRAHRDNNSLLLTSGKRRVTYICESPYRAGRDYGAPRRASAASAAWRQSPPDIFYPSQ